MDVFLMTAFVLLASIVVYDLLVLKPTDDIRAKAEAYDRLNPYAPMLGEDVEVFDLRIQGWVPCVIVCVSWKGSYYVRPTRDLECGGFWVNKVSASSRIRPKGGSAQ